MERNKIEIYFKTKKAEFKVVLEGDPSEDQKEFVFKLASEASKVVTRKSYLHFFRRLLGKAKEKIEGSRSSNIDRYQMHYICDNCGHRDTVYIQKDQKVFHCPNNKCKAPMDIKPASFKGFPHPDRWGNVFVAGKFKSESEWKEQLQRTGKNEFVFQGEGPI